MAMASTPEKHPDASSSAMEAESEASPAADATPPLQRINSGTVDRGSSEQSASQGRRFSKRMEEEEDLASARLLTCQLLAEVVSSTAASLMEAGSALQRGLREASAAGTSLEARLKAEDAPTASAGQGLVEACRGLGVVVVGLASALSGGILAPLQELLRGVEADRAERQEELTRLRQSELFCSNTLTECLQKKDRARAGLQGALRERDKTQRELERKRSLGWLKRRPDEAAASAESKLQRAASLQTAAIEELAVRTDEAMLARMRAQQGALALSETLGYIDIARKNLLRVAFGKCAMAWEEAARALQSSADEFRGSARQLDQATPECPEGKSPRPRWLTLTAGNAASNAGSASAGSSLPRVQIRAPVVQQQPARPSSPASDGYQNTWRRPINPFEDEGRETAWGAREELRRPSRRSTLTAPPEGDSGAGQAAALAGGVPGGGPDLYAQPVETAAWQGRQAVPPETRDTGVSTDSWASPSSAWRPRALTFDDDLSEEEV